MNGVSETMTPSEIFNKAYDILVEHAGAVDGDWQRRAFVSAYLEGIMRRKGESPATEWRFGGHLGFGGKFWRNDGRYYVSCYPEDKKAKQEKVIERTNAELAKLPYWHPRNW